MSKKTGPPPPPTPGKASSCPQCKRRVASDDWRPARGLDPELRHYRCSHCLLKYYTPEPVRRLPRSNLREGTGYEKAAGRTPPPAAPP